MFEKHQKYAALIIMRLGICLQDGFLRKVVRIYLCYKYFIMCLHQVYFAVGEEKVLRTSFIRKMKGAIGHSVNIWVLVTYVRSCYLYHVILFICTFVICVRSPIYVTCQNLR